MKKETIKAWFNNEKSALNCKTEILSNNKRTFTTNFIYLNPIKGTLSYIKYKQFNCRLLLSGEIPDKILKILLNNSILVEKLNNKTDEFEKIN